MTDVRYNIGYITRLTRSLPFIARAGIYLPFRGRMPARTHKQIYILNTDCMAFSFSDIIDKIKASINYCLSGVWREPHNTMRIRIIKTISLSVRSFMDRGLQMKSASLTYSTVLAIVPALALLLAIGRGFGFQDILAGNIFAYFPSQHKAIETALRFVNSYLEQASSGVFVGVGVLMLLWTLVSLLSNIEENFNMIWDIKKDRTMYQKITDYISICILIPILMVCSSGLSIFTSTIIQSNVHFAFLTPIINLALEASPVVLAWLAFTLSFFLIPNTKVQFKYAAIAGALCAVAFQILQLLFVNGQIYVSKYNAIYGSFAFLPLLLIWLQLSWLILLFGCVLTYSMQNVFAFNFLGNVKNISQNYRRKLALVCIAAMVRRFVEGGKPLTLNEFSNDYDIPIRIVSDMMYTMHKVGIVYVILLAEGETGYAPAVDVSKFTVGELFSKIDTVGDSDFVPRFNKIYPDISNKVEEINHDIWQPYDKTLIKDITIPSDAEIRLRMKQ